MAETKKLDGSMIYTSEGDNRLLRDHFKSDRSGNDNPVLLSIRSLLLGFPISKGEADVISSTFAKPDVREAFRRKFFNVLEMNAPIGKEADFWFGSDQEIRDKDRDTIRQVIESKSECLRMLNYAMSLLQDPSIDQLDLSFDADKSADPLQVKFLARNKYIGSVVNCLVQVKLVADATKDETREEKSMRESRNSSK